MPCRLKNVESPIALTEHKIAVKDGGSTTLRDAVANILVASSAAAGRRLARDAN
jgi:hypothetical protein